MGRSWLVRFDGTIVAGGGDFLDGWSGCQLQPDDRISVTVTVGMLTVLVNDAQVAEIPGPPDGLEIRGACLFGGHKVRFSTGSDRQIFRLPRKKRQEPPPVALTRGDLAQLASESSRASVSSNEEPRRSQSFLPDRRPPARQ
jgi:hypothetical protein